MQNNNTNSDDYAEVKWSLLSKKGKGLVADRKAALALRAAIAVSRHFEKKFKLKNEQREKSIPLFESKELVLDTSDNNGEPERITNFFTEMQLRAIHLSPVPNNNKKAKHWGRNEEEQRHRFVDRSIDGHYSVKFLHANIYNGPHAVTAAEEMMMETKLLMNLAPHPNICQLYGVTASGSEAFLCGGGQDGYFILVDRISETLSHRLTSWREEKAYYFINGRQPPPLQNNRPQRSFDEYIQGFESDVMKRLEIALDISSALVFLSDRDITFYLRPDKVGFDNRYGRTKLCDFGQARESGQAMDDESENANFSVTKTDDIRILAYTAPEVLCQAPVTLMSDIYAFGVLLWEILSLQIPFDGYSRRQHFEQVVMQGNRPPLNPKWPDEVKTLIEGCWDANFRPKTKKVADILESSILFLDPKAFMLDEEEQQSIIAATTNNTQQQASTDNINDDAASVAATEKSSKRKKKSRRRGGGDSETVRSRKTTHSRGSRGSRGKKSSRRDKDKHRDSSRERDNRYHSNRGRSRDGDRSHRKDKDRDRSRGEGSGSSGGGVSRDGSRAESRERQSERLLANRRKTPDRSVSNCSLPQVRLAASQSEGGPNLQQQGRQGSERRMSYVNPKDRPTDRPVPRRSQSMKNFIKQTSKRYLEERRRRRRDGDESVYSSCTEDSSFRMAPHHETEDDTTLNNHDPSASTNFEEDLTDDIEKLMAENNSSKKNGEHHDGDNNEESYRLHDDSAVQLSSKVEKYESSTGSMAIRNLSKQFAMQTNYHSTSNDESLRLTDDDQSFRGGKNNRKVKANASSSSLAIRRLSKQNDDYYSTDDERKHASEGMIQYKNKEQFHKNKHGNASSQLSMNHNPDESYNDSFNTMNTENNDENTINPSDDESFRKPTRSGSNGEDSVRAVKPSRRGSRDGGASTTKKSSSRRGSESVRSGTTKNSGGSGGRSNRSNNRSMKSSGSKNNHHHRSGSSRSKERVRSSEGSSARRSDR